MAKLNTEIIQSNIKEAAEELRILQKKIESGILDEIDLQLGLQHAYHHLNFAWNIRHVTTERYANLTEKEFKEWGIYPVDIELDD